MGYQTRRWEFDFRGAHAPPVVASRLGIWCSKITKTAGSPTVQSSSGGPLELTLDNTAEVQNLCLYMGDILPFNIGDIVRFEIVAKLSASIAAAVSGAFGLAGARNDTLATVAQKAWWRFNGSNALLVDTADGTNSQTGVATGFNLAATYRRFVIDFSDQVFTQAPPSLSKGGVANALFKMSNDNGAETRVCPTTRFDLSAYASGLQVLAQIQKTSNAATGTLSILGGAVEYRLPNAL